jgi:hypothetical protein
MRLGERDYKGGIGGKMRCRAITKTGEQCQRRSRTAICGVALCMNHKKSMKPGVPFNYCEVK